MAYGCLGCLSAQVVRGCEVLILISVAFPQAIRDWHALPDPLISAAEGVENGVAKFTSLVRAKD